VSESFGANWFGPHLSVSVDRKHRPSHFDAPVLLTDGRNISLLPLSPSSRIRFIEKLIVAQLLKKLFVLCGTRWFITVYSRVLCWSL
jgi:hypothetical protein